MRILLTGATGNLGFEVARYFGMYHVETVAAVRSSRSLNTLNAYVKEAIKMDLTQPVNDIDFSSVDCIVHSAGNVHFKNCADTNSKMMQSVITLAEKLNAPIYYVSTAFVGNNKEYKNTYEKDKYNAEQLLKHSAIPHTIFRPSILTGNTKTGRLINWTGYYLLVGTFLEASKYSVGEKIRFPILTGTSNMIPVNQVAKQITKAVMSNTVGELIYLTNPKPPKAQWVLEETLDFFEILDKFTFLKMDFNEYAKIKKTRSEEILYQTGTYFNPYWSLHYTFPKSAIKENAITSKYLKNTLSAFKNSHNIDLV